MWQSTFSCMWGMHAVHLLVYTALVHVLTLLRCKKPRVQAAVTGLVSPLSVLVPDKQVWLSLDPPTTLGVFLENHGKGLTGGVRLLSTTPVRESQAGHCFRKLYTTRL